MVRHWKPAIAMKYALKLIFLKCTFELMINTAPTASNNVYDREKLFWYDKINFSNLACHCGAVVKELLALADKPRSTPGDAVFCFFLPFFFFPVWSLFLTLFFLLAFISLFLLLTLPVMNLDQWYFKLKSGVLFWERDFKSSLSAYWPSLRLDKNHKPCQDMSLLWNSWILTHSTPQTVLIYTHHPPVTHWRKLNLPFVHRLNHQYYYPKISTGFAPKK